MNDYEERKAAKADRYRQYAENAGKRADVAFDGVRRLVSLDKPREVLEARYRILYGTKRDDTCAQCGSKIPRGSQARWYQVLCEIRCLENCS